VAAVHELHRGLAAERVRVALRERGRQVGVVRGPDDQRRGANLAEPLARGGERLRAVTRGRA